MTPNKISKSYAYYATKATTLYHEGLIVEAETYFELALKAAEKEGNKANIMAAKANLAAAYIQTDSTSDAITLLTEASRLHEEGQVTQEETYKTILDNLTTALNQEKRYDDAIVCQKKKLKLCKSIAGWEQNFAEIYNTLAVLFMGNCDWQNAEENFNTSLASTGSTPLMKAQTYTDMGKLFATMGRYSEAFEFTGRSERIFKNNKVEEPEDLIASYLARQNHYCLYINSGKITEARSMIKETIKFSESKLRNILTEEDFLREQWNQAFLSQYFGEYSTAKSTMEKIILDPGLGDLLKSELECYTSRFFLDIGEFDRAKALLKNDKRPINKIHVQEILCHVIAHLTFADYEKADSILKVAVKRAEKEFGPYNSTMLDVLSPLANLKIELAQFEEAEKHLAQALKIAEVSFGKDNVNTAQIYNSLTDLNLRMNQIDEACKMNQSAIKIYEVTSPRSYLGYLQAETQRAQLSLTKKDYLKALDILEEILDLQKKYLEEGNPVLASTQHHLGTTHLKLKFHDTSEAFINKALNSRKKHYGEDHPKTLSTMSNLAAVKAARKKYSEAAKILEEVLEKREKIYPEGHVSIDRTRRSISRLKEKVHG